MARITVGEALTNIVFAVTEPMDHIKASGNWMWPAKLPGEADSIYRACEAMSEVMIKLGVAVDGGKDSLSMAAKSGTNTQHHKEELVKTPGTLVVSLYAPMDDVMAKVNPAIRCAGKSTLIFIDMGLGKQRLGGSILAQSYAQIGSECPDLDDPEAFSTAWNAVRRLISEGLVLSGHDRSDGGLIVTLLEMAFAGDCGFDLQAPAGYCNPHESIEVFTTAPWFNEELGVVLEVLSDAVPQVLQILTNLSVPGVHVLGKTTETKHVVIGYYSSDTSESILDESMVHLRDIWEATSFELEKLQANTLCVRQEQLGLCHRKAPAYKLTYGPASTIPSIIAAPSKPKVAVIREEGSNGDREMGAAFYSAGFEVWDVNMKDLVAGNITLEAFQGVAFVGGFSYADVMDSAKGWAGTIRFHTRLLEQFDHFINKRQDTFSLGICNGCQLMALLGYVPFPSKKLDSHLQPRFIHNTSGRFESRFSTVTILKSPAIMFKDMEGSTLGIWLSHGEGRAYFPEDSIKKEVLDNHLAPLRYADDDGHPTEFYPFNPNGSPHGIAALCSEDGRHLAMMPHAERTAWTFNWPWMPEAWRAPNHPCTTVSPWTKIFQNAYAWAMNHQQKA
jgi:phosphoribosylformylglycinamidine synthase